MSEPTEKFATPRVAAGALFVDGSRVLLVRKTYGNRWDIPGGYVERGETPTEACAREIREELGLDRSVVRVLVHDWAPNDEEGDKLLYVFDCGELGDDEQRIHLDGKELDHWEWVEVERLQEYVMPRLARRLSHGTSRLVEESDAVPGTWCTGVGHGTVTFVQAIDRHWTIAFLDDFGSRIFVGKT